jgi:hypothetical protein
MTEWWIRSFWSLSMCLCIFCCILRFGTGFLPFRYHLGLKLGSFLSADGTWVIWSFSWTQLSSRIEPDWVFYRKTHHEPFFPRCKTLSPRHIGAQESFAPLILQSFQSGFEVSLKYEEIAIDFVWDCSGHICEWKSWYCQNVTWANCPKRIY